MKINTPWLVVSFFTHNTPYESVMKDCLVASLDKNNIDYYIEAIDSQGSWLHNVAMKPKVILNAMLKYPNKDIVCLDADSEITTYPNIFDNIPKEYDIALHKLNWKTWYGHNTDTKEVLSGTVYIRNNDKMKELVNAWATHAASSFEWEQKVLSRLLDTMKIDVYELPIEYCYIKTLPSGKPPIIKVDKPIIVHHQASRTLRKKIR